jgi:hypothetical protein
VVTPQVKDLPSESEENVRPPGTAVGIDVAPQQNAAPAAVTPQLVLKSA